MKKREKFDQPCTASCRSRYGDLCIRNPGLGLISDKVLYLQDPSNADKGEYQDRNPIAQLKPQILCPYSKPKRARKSSDTATDVLDPEGGENGVEGIVHNHEFSDPNSRLTLKGLIREGMNHGDGVMLAGIYIGSVFYYLLSQI